MRKEYFITYGCYLNMEAQKAIVDYPDNWSINEFEEAMNGYLYHMAKDVAESYYGMHGFGEDEDSEEVREDTIEQNCDYAFEEWNDGHAPSCTYGEATEPDEIEIDFT